MKSITVFTPTFNRAYCLDKLYASLLRQSSKDFIWLIIDDGSQDNTKMLVSSWQHENKIDITYIYQENGGMLAAHNTAYDNISTALNICVDSDDYLTDHAIEFVLEKWSEFGKEEYAGLVGLDARGDGSVIGSKFPDSLKEATYADLKSKHKMKGDKKYVYRTDVINKYPRYPSFENEKFPAQGYLYRLIGVDYKLLVFNEVLCIVEYMPDGNSNNKMSSYMKNAKAFAYYRSEMLRLSPTYPEKFRHAIHYISSCLFAKSKIFDGKNNITLALAFPFGLMLNAYIKRTKRKGILR